MRRRTLIAALAASGAQPAAAQAPGRTYRLAILTQATPVDPVTGRRERAWTAFFDELRRLGYEESGNLAVTWHSSEGEMARASEAARRVVALGPDAIFSPDARMASVLRTAAGTIPVVTVTVDPVGAGVADSLARPGGNVTGFSVDAGLELLGKRLDLMKQAVPAARTIGWLAPSRLREHPVAEAYRAAARAAGIATVDGLVEAPVDEAAYRRAFAAMLRGGAETLSVASTLENLAYRQLIAELAIAAKLPSMFGFRENVEAGGLMSYGNDAADTFRRSAGYIDRILRGANPAEMPFQQPDRFALVINLRTAKALGLALPTVLVAAADEVIE